MDRPPYRRLLNVSGRSGLLFAAFLAFLFAMQVAIPFTGCTGKNAADSSGNGEDDDNLADDDATDDDAVGDDDSGPGMPTSPSGHDNSWDCYLCHDQDFLGAKGEPHDHQISSPDHCVACHKQGTWQYTNPNAPVGHGTTQNCLDCHQSLHDKTWTDPAQCLTCHKSGLAPTYPVAHKGAWDCYLCHADNFFGALGEPHNHQYTSPSDCINCHKQGDWTYTDPNAPAGHGSSQSCMDCHQGLHSKTWTDKAQCLVCHLPGTAAPQFSNLHDTSWNCYICHASAFNGAPQEPHNHQYTAPGDCLTCHSKGNFSNPAHGPTPDDHDSSSNCLNCHSGQHSKSWQNRTQCLICHQF